MRKKILAGVFALIGLSVIAVLGNSPKIVSRMVQTAQTVFAEAGLGKAPSEIIQKQSENTIVSDTGINKNENISFSKEQEQRVVPEEILWQMAFSLPQRIDREAAKLNQEGKDDSIWTGYITRQAKLSVENETVFRITAANFYEEVAPIDREANNLIKEIRTKFPDGKADPKNLPLPPAELGELQKKKNEVVLRYRDSFKAAVGDQPFAEFKGFLDNEFSRGINPISVPTPAMKDNEGGNK